MSIEFVQEYISRLDAVCSNGHTPQQLIKELKQRQVQLPFYKDGGKSFLSQSEFELIQKEIQTRRQALIV